MARRSCASRTTHALLYLALVCWPAVARAGTEDDKATRPAGSRAYLRVPATRVWTGGSATDNNWTSADNWGGTAPVAGDDLVFDATGVGARPAPSNNFPAGTTFGTITISASGYSIGGNSVNLSTGLVANTYASGTSSVSLVIATGSVTMNAAGILALSGANTFGGGLAINSGTVSGSTSATVFGTSSGVITLGNTTGSAAATLQFNTNGLTYANPIVLAAGTTGALTISGNGGSGTFSGGVTGANDLRVTGGITFSTNTVNNAGSVKNTGGGVASTFFSGGIGHNVTRVETRVGAGMIISGPLSINSSGTTLQTNAGAMVVTGGTTGAGELVLEENVGLNGRIDFTGSALNHTGTITVTGNAVPAGDNVWLRAPIGGNVTGITISGLARVLATGGVTVGSGNLTITNVSGALATMSTTIGGTGNVVLNNNSSVNAAIAIHGGFDATGTATNSGTGTGSVTMSATISTNVTGVVQNSATSKLVLSGTNTFTSGLTIKAGTVTANSTSGLGAASSVVLLGNTTGSDNATLEVATASLTIANPIVLASGTTGTLTVASTASTVVFSGGVTGSNNLSLHNGSTGTLTFSTASINNAGTVTNAGSGSGALNVTGGVGSNVTGLVQNSATSAVNVQTTALTVNATGTTLTNAHASGALLTVAAGVAGTGNLVLQHNGAATGGIQLNTTPVNHSGGITNSGMGTGTAVINSDVGANVTAVVQNSATSMLVVAGALVLGASGKTLANTSASGSSPLSITGGSDGSGHLVLNNNTAIAAGITVSGSSLNHTGAITNSGTGTGTVAISNPIGSNVTSVTQHSATSQLVLSAANAFTGGLTIKAGTVVGSSDAAVFGAGSITLGNTSGSADATLVPLLSVANPIVLASGTTGTLSLRHTLPGALTLAGSVTGANNLTIDHAGTGTFGFLPGGVNHAGTITNRGDGTNTVSLAGVLGSNVTGVVQNSLTSSLELSGTNANTGIVTITAGTLAVGSVSGFGSSSTLVFAGGTLKALAAMTIPASTVTLSSTATINTNGFAVTFSGALSGNGGLTKAGAGTLTLGGGGAVGGPVTISEGTLAAPSSAGLSVAGDWTNDAAFNANGGTVTLNGGSAQSLGGSRATTFNNLTINSAGVSIATSPTVTSVLTFAAGKITTGLNKVIVAATGFVAGGAAGRYINGNLERFVPNGAAPSLAFDVGDATRYAPVSIAFAGTTTGSGSLTASTVSGDHADVANSELAANKSVNRTWTVTNGGVAGFSSYAATFGFDAADVDAGANSAGFVVRKLDGGMWTRPPTGTRTTTSTQATGQTGFSVFQIGEAVPRAAISTLTPIAGSVTATEFDSLTELREDIEGRLRTQLTEELDVQFRELAVDRLVEASRVEVADRLVDARAAELWQGMVRSLERRGLNAETYLQLTNTDPEQLTERLRTEARQSIARELVLEAAADKLDLQVPDEEVEALVREQAADTEDAPEEIIRQLRESGAWERLRADLRLRNALDRVVEEVQRIPVELARARDKLWTSEQEKTEPTAKLWIPGSKEPA